MIWVAGTKPNESTQMIWGVGTKPNRKHPNGLGGTCQIICCPASCREAANLNGFYICRLNKKTSKYLYIVIKIYLFNDVYCFKTTIMILWKRERRFCYEQKKRDFHFDLVRYVGWYGELTCSEKMSLIQN